MEYIRLETDSDGIVELIFDQQGKDVNVMGLEYEQAMSQAVAELESMKDRITGVYVRSGKPGQFFAGGDITAMLELDLDAGVEKKEEMFAGIMQTKALLRRLETLGVPVVCGINGAALGGGFEIALACHHRLALKNVAVGLPEAQIGLMPGADGVVRLVRYVGMQEAIGLISTGKRLKAEAALEKGLLHQLFDTEEEMHAAARAWIVANPQARQPWDQDGFKIPGGSPSDKDDQAIQGLMFFGPANVMTQTRGLMPAQKAIFAAVVDVARVDFDTAAKIEARYFLSLLLDQTARNMMTAFFVQMNALNKGASRPDGYEKTAVSKLGLLGAGQMGAGIAFVAAKNGIEVVLKDISLEAAERGKAYSAQVCESNKRIDEDQAEEILSRIHPTADYEDLRGCDLVIEAVFENRGVKATVTRESEAVLGEEAVFASNTSALPITELAEASVRRPNFVGMHFFSPAEKMPLVEIIAGEQTSDATLAKAFDLAQQLGKTPIVVNDGPGFFTSRVIGKTIAQGHNMLEESVDPVLIESAAKFNGSPVGPLSAIDEISQETAYKNGLQARADVEEQGGVWEDNAASRVLERMVNDFGRKGKVHGGGYYEYPETGKKFLWPGLRDAFAAAGYTELPYQDIKDRLTFCQSLEAVRAMQEGVIDSVGDGNIGSIMGIGFPAQTGGVFQAINAYGVKAFAERAVELAERYGEDFTPPALLLEKAEKGELFT
ncbi:MAG: 3-hydroxyacyl-CoA dehydrogenase NAD-binding domain-containing protein [Gammaproteobacteria bacterium]|nr:3-hydroxyacyl-CoA dehydrogenase NAD-binding domain-containing protein [Gammaproteobacteria bacterium]